MSSTGWLRNDTIPPHQVGFDSKLSRGVGVWVQLGGGWTPGRRLRQTESAVRWRRTGELIGRDRSSVLLLCSTERPKWKSIWHDAGSRPSRPGGGHWSLKRWWSIAHMWTHTHTRTHVKTHAHTSREGAAFSWILISLWWGAKEKWRDGIHNNKKWSDDRSILFSRHLIRLCQPLGLLFSTGIAGKTLGLTQGNPKLSLRRLHSACSNH